MGIIIFKFGHNQNLLNPSVEYIGWINFFFFLKFYKNK